ncbi:MAG: hypothetical protein PF495_13605 [Spirochaetales bacterium]|jgi:hypothetical protein|nr:hypothetical protein [Spirochaetales bacterium]
MSNLQTTNPEERRRIREEKLVTVLRKLEQASAMSKVRFQSSVLDMARRLLELPGGVERLCELAPRCHYAGLFLGTDWANPAVLQPALVKVTLEKADRNTVILECLSQLRFLALAKGVFSLPEISGEEARQFLTQMMAANLKLLFEGTDETMRVRLGPMAEGVGELFSFLQGHLGLQDIISNVVNEIWRIMTQRPIQVDHIKRMVSRIALSISQGIDDDIGESRLGIDRLSSALFGPTHGCMEDPGLEAYRDRLVSMDFASLQQEAGGFARAMHDVGLVSEYHAVFLRLIMTHEQEALLTDALGLSTTGLDSLRNYQELVHTLLLDAIYPETAQAIYGLTMLLERGVLYSPPIAPGLWQQINLKLSAQATVNIAVAFGESRPAKTFLLAGVIALLGQPFGVGQGNNPTCQAARALSMWAYIDPDFLLYLVTRVARYDSVTFNFEGQAVVSSALPAGLFLDNPLDTDPVSTLLVPHLDRIYFEMGRLCVGRDEDPHRWVNREFHGRWVGNDFVIAVDVGTGKLKDYDLFIKRLYTSYNPFFNGNQPIIHPQPAGVAVTDSLGQFVGWHAITLLRVAIDQEDVMRFYFYNPNNDSGQDWGKGVVVSTQGQGERFGEASLPFAQLASRLYIYHDDPEYEISGTSVPVEIIEDVKKMALASWAADRILTNETANAPENGV